MCLIYSKSKIIYGPLNSPESVLMAAETHAISEHIQFFLLFIIFSHTVCRFRTQTTLVAFTYKAKTLQLAMMFSFYFSF